MIDERTEARFRGLSMAPYNKEFTQIWKTVLEDIDIRAALKRLLFVPSADPDTDQAAVFSDIFAALTGEANNLVFHDDLVTTEARVVCVKTACDHEGLCFDVTYSFSISHNEAVEVTHQFQYDGMKAAMAGWGSQRLDRHWRVGRRLTCRYKKSRPTEHAIEAPFAWRPSRDIIRLALRGAS